MSRYRILDHKGGEALSRTDQKSLAKLNALGYLGMRMSVKAAQTWILSCRLTGFTRSTRLVRPSGL